MRRLLCFAVLLTLLASPASAAPSPGPWGVVVHTPFHADALRSIGVQWVRIEVRWIDTEKTARGVYDWSAADKLLNYYLEHGFHVIAILGIDAASSFYRTDATNLPELQSSIATWAGAAAKRFAKKGIVWELGNEPQVFPLNGLWRVPENYAAVARAEAAAIRKADPSARIAALSAAWIDRNFIVRALDAGLLKDGTISLISYHGYHRPKIAAESGLAEDIAWLRSTLARHAPKGKAPTVIDSERGYALAPPETGKHWGNWRNIVHTEAEQAAYLARHYLESIASGVDVIVWYKDAFGEEGFSLYYTDETDPKGLRPMGHVYRNLSQLLPDRPSDERNEKYDVTLLNNLKQTSDPNTLLNVRSYLRRIGKREQLVVAMWNPVESAGSQVLDTRRRQGENFVETWRAVAPEDHAVLNVQLQVHGVAKDRIARVATYDLLANASAVASTTIEPTLQATSLITPALAVGAMPVVVVIDLK